MGCCDRDIQHFAFLTGEDWSWSVSKFILEIFMQQSWLSSMCLWIIQLRYLISEMLIADSGMEFIPVQSMESSQFITTKPPVGHPIFGGLAWNQGSQNCEISFSISRKLSDLIL